MEKGSWRCGVGLSAWRNSRQNQRDAVSPSVEAEEVYWLLDIPFLPQEKLLCLLSHLYAFSILSF